MKSMKRSATWLLAVFGDRRSAERCAAGRPPQPGGQRLPRLPVGEPTAEPAAPLQRQPPGAGTDGRACAHRRTTAPTKAPTKPVDIELWAASSVTESGPPPEDWAAYQDHPARS